MNSLKSLAMNCGPLSEMILGRAAGYRRRWLPHGAPPPWLRPLYRPASRVAPGPCRSWFPPPPAPSCGVRRANTPCLPRPIRDRGGSGPVGNGGRLRSAFQLHRPQGGEQALGALIVIPRLSAAGASGPWGGVSRLGQQRRQYSGPGPMQPGASGHFDGLQVQAGALPLGRKHSLEKRLDFPCDFLMNSRSRFFSASVQPAASGSAGRKRQICSLTAVNSAVRSCKRWNSVTSSAALRNAAGVAKDSATLLPLTLRSRRNCGWPAPSGRAQWQLGLPQRRGTADMVPGRKSPRVRNCRNSLFRAASSSAREWGTRHPPFSVYIYTENPDNPGLYRKTSISMSRTRGAGIH